MLHKQGDTKWHTVTWLPLKYAVEGEVVEVRGKSWVVRKACKGITLTHDQINKRGQDHKHQRQASDI